MNDNNSCSYRFNSFLLDVKERQLSSGSAHVPLTPKAFDVLVYLVTHGGHLVRKDELMQAVWPDSFVDEVNLPRTIHTLRKILGDYGNGNKFIETVPTKGYRFIAQIEEISESGSDLRLISPVVQEVPATVVRVNGDETEIVANGNSKTEIFTAKVRSRFRTRLILAGVVLIIAAAGFWFFKSSGAAVSIVRRLTPETFSGEAYQNYQQGKFLVERRHPGDYPKAGESFDKAIKLDPNYSAAYAARADVKVVAFWGSHSHEDISGARTDVRKAIELDPSNSYAHTVLCRILTTYDWDHKEAEKECREGIELNPNDHEAQREFAFLMHSLGREDEALAAMDKAIAIAPTSFNKRSRGMILYQSGRYDEAIAQLEQVEETDPVYNETTRWLIRAYEMKGDYPHALECYLRLTQGSGATAEEVAAIRTAYETEGWSAVLRHMADSSNMRNLFRVGTFAQLGDKEKAFDTLDGMLQNREILLVTIAREPTLEPLRSDPRFGALLKRIGLE